MLKRYRFIAIVLTHLALALPMGAAQESEEARPAEESTEPQTPMPAAELGHVYLRPINGQDDGRLVAAPSDVTLEKYLRNRDLLRGFGPEPEEPRIRSFSATGVAKANRVDLSVKLQIEFEAEREGWVKVPLRFNQASLRRVPRGVDAANQRIDIEAVEGGESSTTMRRGYVLWLRGRGGGRGEEVTLDFSVPLTERRLVLSVPLALVSEFRLTVPMADADAEVPVGTGLEQEANGEDATDLILTGFRGEIDVKWRRPNGMASQAAPVLKSFGIIRATVDRRSVDFDATLNVNVEQPYGRELSRFLVRLPPGAVLMEQREPNYTVTDVTPVEGEEGKGDGKGKGGEENEEANEPVPDEPPATDVASEKDDEVGNGPVAGETPANQEPRVGRLVEVALARPAINSEPVEVNLRARSDAPLNGQFPLAGFEVSNAVDQFGFYEVRARGDWDVRCDTGRGVIRVSEIPGGQDSEDVIAKYRYFDQPFTLAARVFPKQVRISVEPRYVLSIDRDMARLAATLKYAVRGNKAFQLKINVNGWKVDRVGPEHLVVIPKSWEPDKSGMLVISLQDGVVNDFELSLDAHRPIDAAEHSLELPMPKPDANSLSSTGLKVLPADNIELREDWGEMQGLEQTPPPSPFELSESQQEPLYYRGQTSRLSELGKEDKVVFAAVMSVREQEITAESKTEIQISSEKATIKERLIYDVKYEPTDALVIRVPRDLSVDYSLGGAAVTVADVDDAAVGDDSITRQIILPGPRQGQLELTAQYTVPVDGLQPLVSVPCAIPLVVPENVSFAGHRVEARVDKGIGIWRKLGSSWQEVLGDESSHDVSSDMVFVSDTPEEFLVVGVQQKDPDTYGSALVEAAWIQTRMNDSQRRDRAVYRFLSDRRHLVVSLPTGVDTDRLRVLIDGDEARYDVVDQSVSVVLNPEQFSDPHILELRYFSELRPTRGTMQLELPQFGDDVWVRRCYWQLVLPNNEHVVTVPRDYTAEYEWAWKGAWWGRVPVHEQVYLEEWVGTVSDMPVPEATSRYLFSKFGPAESAALVTASRTWIVGVASAATLLIGLVLVYFPATRHPLFGLIGVVAIVAGAVVWPGASLLCAQAAGMGLVLSLLGAILYRGMARRRRRTVRRDVPSSIFERGSTQAQMGSSEIELMRSTATEAGAAAQAPER